MLSCLMLENEATGFSPERFRASNQTERVRFHPGDALRIIPHSNQRLTEFSYAFDSSFDGSFRTTTVIAQKFSLRAVMRHPAIQYPTIFATVVPETITHRERISLLEGTNIMLNATFKIVRVNAFGPAIA